jgi:hypothetical protein
MKRLLNLNDTSLRAVLVLLISGGLSILLHLVGLILGHLGLQATWLEAGSRLFLWVTFILLGLFLLLLIVEGIQDAVYDAIYRRRLGIRLQGPGSFFECPFCGSQRVRAFDRVCPVCGKELE